MVSTIAIVVLVTVPLGFLAGQLLFSRTGTSLRVVPEQPRPQPIEPSNPWAAATFPPSDETMLGEMARLRAERDDLRNHVLEAERTTNDLRAELEGSSTQLLASSRQMERAENIPVNDGAKLADALAGREDAIGRLEAELASHAATRRSLAAAENHLKLLEAHLAETGGAIESVGQGEWAAQVADLQQAVTRLERQLRSAGASRVPVGHR